MENENNAAIIDGTDAGNAKTRQFGIGQLLPIALIVVGAVWIYIGLTEFGFFNRLKGGTPGFLPIVAASVLLVASLFSLAQSVREKQPQYNLLCFGFLLMCAAVVGLSYLVGLLPALLLFVFVWIKIIERNPWKGTIIVLLILAGVGYGLFQIALKVPFPIGLLFETIL